ncbi:MAG: SRPBCC family protein [Phycisphaerales bacterium]|jgi:hypothetical protein
MVGREHDGIWVTLKETIHAAPPEVALCVTSASGLTRWIAVDCEFDGRDDEEETEPRTGDEPPTRLAISWDRQWKHTTEVRILELDDARALDGFARIRFEWFPSPIDDTPVPVEISVSPLPESADGTGGARVILRHGPFPGNPDALIFMADSAESWRWYLCNLRSVLEQKHDMRSVRPL